MIDSLPQQKIIWSSCVFITVPVGEAGGKIGIDRRVPIIEALREVTVSLRQGDRVGLVGHNGAGNPPCCG